MIDCWCLIYFLEVMNIHNNYYDWWIWSVFSTAKSKYVFHHEQETNSYDSQCYARGSLAQIHNTKRNIWDHDRKKNVHHICSSWIWTVCKQSGYSNNFYNGFKNLDGLMDGRYEWTLLMKLLYFSSNYHSMCPIAACGYRTVFSSLGLHPGSFE